jgi:hypothetical protein
MINDRNKTSLTKSVTQAALAYLDERGCKPIETEVTVCQGWVADLAGVLCPTMTELVLLRLIGRRPNRFGPAYEEWKTKLKQMQRLMTVLVEVKTSRSDFYDDRKWKLSQPTNLAYLAIPNDLPIKPEEYPEAWGILSYSSGTKLMRCVRPPELRPVRVDDQLSVILEIAVRRDNNTRYERLRELQREIRCDQNVRINRMRMTTAMQAVLSIVRGHHESVEGVLDYYGVKEISAHMIEELQQVWAVAPGEKA